MVEACLSLGAPRSLLREQEESVGRIVLLVAVLMVLFTTCFVILVYVSHFCLIYDGIEYMELPAAGPYDSPPRSRSNRFVLRARLVARRAVTALRHGGHAATGLASHPLSLQQQSQRQLHCPSFRLKDLTKGTFCGGQGECPICLSQYEDIDTVTHLPCRHLFHLDCLEKYRIPAFPVVLYASFRVEYDAEMDAIIMFGSLCMALATMGFVIYVHLSKEHAHSVYEDFAATGTTQLLLRDHSQASRLLESSSSIMPFRRWLAASVDRPNAVLGLPNSGEEDFGGELPRSGFVDIPVSGMEDGSPWPTSQHVPYADPISCCVMAIATLAFVCYVRMDGKSEEDQLLIDTEEEEADQCPMLPLETEAEPWAADYSSIDDDVL
ncbi:hypothetical protein FOZ62_021845 [Perkinsus olseni]|uniref:RING-type domain-containing protein n=1 Tax=Perkinsus olseni TaxID=32597 RepID=A0A7J6NJP0_PEROL|nr:hypothetical protein FOZ62_021845 [Perkinsus olseni]